MFQRKWLAVAVGTCVSSHAPRTEPYVRLVRIRLPPWVCDGEAIARPRMEDDWFREPDIHQRRHPCPRAPVLLATTPQRAPPEVGDMVPERGQCLSVGRHGVVVEVAGRPAPAISLVRGSAGACTAAAPP